MSEQEEWKKNTIHFGSLVTLSFRDEKGTVYFACCEGFTKNKLRLKTFETLSSEGKFNSCLFKILPPFYNSEYLKTKKKFEDRLLQPIITSIERREALTELPKQIKAMQEECALNLEQYEKVKGSPVFFGQTVQFLHYNSNKYLQFDQHQISDFESDSLRLQNYNIEYNRCSLDAEHGDETYFKFLNCFSFQQETGGFIFNEDTVYVVSTLDTQGTQEPGLHASKLKESKNDGPQAQQRELNVSPEQRSFFKVTLFSEYLDEKEGFLSIFDVIWMNFSESDLNLVVQRYSRDESVKYLKFQSCETTEKFQKFIGDSNGMFVIEGEDVTQGGKVQWDKPYRLRHLTTNRYLALDSFDNSDELNGEDEGSHSSLMSDESVMQFRLVAVQDVHKAYLFKFELIYSTLNNQRKELALQFLEKDSYFRLSAFKDSNNEESSSRQSQNMSNCYWLRTKGIVANDIYVVEGQNFIQEIEIPVFHAVKKEENVFKLTKANINEVRMTAFLISCMKTIQTADDYLQIDLEDKTQFHREEFQQNYKRLKIRTKRLENCIYDLHLFCYNKLLGYISFSQEYGATNSFIQGVLREQSFIEILVRILVVSFPTEESLSQLEQFEGQSKEQQDSNVRALMSETNQAHTKNNQLLENQIVWEFLSKKKRVCILVYRLLSSICDNNILNQERCSKYLPIFALQSLFLPGAIKCMIAVVSNYQELILNVSKDSITNLNPNLLKSLKSVSVPSTATKVPKTRRLPTHKKTYNYEHYRGQYKIFAAYIINFDDKFELSWDLLMFFSVMLKRSKSFAKKKEIVEFLKCTAAFEGLGVNINQELAYRYILQDGQVDRVFEDEVLIRIKSDGPQLKVYRNGEEQSLLDYFYNHDQILKGNTSIKQERALVPYICSTMNMFAVMCNSRNYTWKKFAENFFNVESLVENLLNKQYKINLRSIICNMLTRLYVDQEPRRTIAWPELCKVVRTDAKSRGDLNNTQISEEFKQGKGELKSDPVDVLKVQERILEYSESLAHLVDQYSQLIVLTQGPTEKKSGLKEIFTQAPNIYNEHTLEMIRLFKQLVVFGKYAIKTFPTIEETHKDQKNQALFTIIRSLVSVLEFNTMYPETRMIMVNRRIKDAKVNTNSLFTIGKSQEPKEVKKQFVQSGDDGSEDFSQGESFQKQVEVMMMLMNDFMYDQGNPYDVHIKLEICTILHLYLDFKMDFYLNNLKLKFKEWTDKLELFFKIYIGQIDIDKQSDIEIIKTAFCKQIKCSIKTILPEILRTGIISVDESDINLKTPVVGLVGLMATVSVESLAKELQAISINKVVGWEIFPSLLSIFCTTQNLELQTQLLSVITRIYNQRYEFADLTSKLLLLFDEENIRIFKKSKKLIRRLAKNVDEAETWVQNLAQDSDHMNTLNDTMGIFEQFTELLFAKSFFDDHDNLVNSVNQEIDQIRQDIMRHLKIDKLGVDLIKDSLFMVSMETDPRLLEKLKGMFQVCFRFLTQFVKNNQVNQMVLSQYITPLLSHMDTDLGQVELFCELFRNNKKICVDRMREVIDDFARLIQQNGRQAKYLEFFMIVHKVKNEYISSNQRAVLNQFIDPRFKQTIFYMTEPQHLQTQKSMGDKKQSAFPRFDFTPKVDPNNSSYLDEPYVYHAKLIEVLASCTIGKDGLLHSENILKQLITFRYIMELMLNEDLLTTNRQLNPEEMIQDEQPKGDINLLDPPIIIQNIPKKIQETDPEGITALKSPLLNLIFYTYLESEKISDEIFKCLPEIILFIRKELVRLLTILTYKDEYVEYFFSHFMLTINGFIKVFNKELGAQVLQAGSPIALQFNQWQKELDNLRQAMQIAPIMITFKLTERQKTLLELFQFENIMKEDQNKLSKADQAQLDQMKADASQKQQPFIPPPALKRKRTIQMSERTLSTDQIWKELWQIFLEQLLNSPQLSDQIKSEQEVFAKAIFKVEEIFLEDMSVSEMLSKQAIFKRLIGFLEKSRHDPSNIVTFKLILKVLCNYIQIEEPLPPGTIEEDIKGLIEEQKQQNQNFINSCNGMQMALALMSDYSDPVFADEVFNDLVYFAIQLMDGGNRDIQRCVWKYFENFPSSEVFFMRIHNKIQKTIYYLKKTEADENVKIWEFKRNSDLINNILRLMQLFAEGHFTELQEYMHFQHNNYHNYDLIQDFIELLTAYMDTKNIKEENFDNMMQNFDTLTEFIQGPCHINQVALLQGNFLDLATNLLLIDEILLEFDIKIEGQRRSRQKVDLIFQEVAASVKPMKPFPRWMYARLKYKCSITLISLLEARRDNEIVNRMMKSLNIPILKRNISDIFYLFQEQYEEKYSPQIFKHFQKTPQTDNEQELAYASFIIETGFNLFIIYCIFLEVKQQGEGYSSAGEVKKEPTFMEKFKQSILGKLYVLFLNIILSLHDSALEMKKRAQSAIFAKNEMDYKLVKDALIERRNRLFRDAKPFFLSHTAHIEVLREDKEIEKTYFSIPPFCLHLDALNKTKFNEEASRASIKSKVTSLQQSADDIIKVMKLNFQIQLLLNKFKVLAVVVENIDLLRDFCFLLALVINGMILFNYQKLEKSNVNGLIKYDLKTDNFTLRQTVHDLGLVSIAFSMVIVIFFLSRNAPLLIEKAWVGVKQDKLQLIGYIIRIFKTFWFLLTDFFVLYYLLYGFAAVFGTILHPFFFSFHLFEVLIRFPVLLNVVKSVWQPKRQILYTGLLFLIMMYVFTLFAYIMFNDSYPQGFCDSTWGCFLTTMDVSFKYDSGLGGFLISSFELNYELPKKILRFFFDNLYNALLLIIMLNILSGIIIDTFGSLREELSTYTNDLTSFCFICGYDKETIEKESTNQISFNYHLKNEHYQWYYLFYIAYLKEKDPTEYTGIESYVAEKIEQQNISWFPLNKALCIRNDLNDDGSKQALDQLLEIKTNTKELTNYFQQINGELDHNIPQ